MLDPVDVVKTPLAALTSDVSAPVVLVVDDEPSILSALRRLLRGPRYEVLTADSGAAALEILATRDVDLIISDMRMPNMSGAEFLAQAQRAWPDTMRILLTGYSEIDSVVRAINDGGVYRYLDKPWNDQDLLLTVAQALEQRRLRKETVRLTELTQQQNIALQHFNAQLEAQVLARTDEIRQTVMFLEDSQRDLKNNFAAMVKVCASMIELRCGILDGRSLRIAEGARRLALALGINSTHAQELYFAGLLQGIGKLSLTDDLLHTPVDQMSPAQTQRFYQHPLRAQMVLTPVAELSQVAVIILHQYERFNGRGTPDELAGIDIPIGSRILAVARDFEGLCHGGISRNPVSTERAIQVLQSQAGLRYDPEVVACFVSLLNDPKALSLDVPVMQVNSLHLKEGMRLAKDLRNARGVLLMTKDNVVSAHQVEQLRRFEREEGSPFAIIVHAADHPGERVDARAGERAGEAAATAADAFASASTSPSPSPRSDHPVAPSDDTTAGKTGTFE